ncbi:MAG: O-antigen ligase family protein [Lachnospiraceae bacterium]|nr:O-antigen ligase family protein [Lachnospiraceae bacterium]
MINKMNDINVRKFVTFPLCLLMVLPGIACISTLILQDTKAAYYYFLYFLLGDSCLLLGGIFVCQSLMRKESIEISEKIGALFLTWALVCVLFAKDQYLAFYGADYRMEGYLGILIYASFYLCGAYLTNSRQKRILLDWFLYSSVPVTFVFWCQKLRVFRVFLNLEKNVYLIMGQYDSGVFQHHNHYGYYLTMVILCAATTAVFSKKKKRTIVYSFVFLCNGFALAANDTMGGILAVVVGLLVFIVLIGKRNRELLIVSVVPLVTFICILLIYNSTSHSMTNNYQSMVKDIGQITKAENIDSIGTGRGRLWKQAVMYIKDHPIVGYGPDGLGELYQRDGFVQDRPANEYLQYIGFFGIPGLFLYLGFISSIGFPRLKILKQLSDIQMIVGVCIIGYLCSAFFGNSVYNTTSYLFLFLGFLKSEV